MTSRRSRCCASCPTTLRGAARAGRLHGHGLLQPRADRHQDARAWPWPSELEAALRDQRGRSRVRWSGCPASCGNHHTADIGLQGCKVKVNGKIVDGVHVFVGGRGGADPRRRRADPRRLALRRAAGRARPARSLSPRAENERRPRREVPAIRVLRGRRPRRGRSDHREGAAASPRGGGDRARSPDRRELLEHASAEAEIIDAGKAPGRQCPGQSHINWLLVDRAAAAVGSCGSRGRSRRLRPSDRGSRGRARRRYRIRDRAGVSAAMAAAARAGISLTERGRASMLVFATGADQHGTLPALDWEPAGARRGTLASSTWRWARCGPITASAAIARPRCPRAGADRRARGFADERVLAGRLGDIAEQARQAQVTPPALLLVGPTVSAASAPRAAASRTAALASL